MQRATRLLGGAALLAAVVVAGTSPLSAQVTDDVVNSKHNMRNESGLTDYGEVCVYCHTPHAGQSIVALWNRDVNTGSYSMYDAVFSSTMDMTVAASPQGVSLACLSCHDGTIGLDVILNVPNADTTLTGDPSRTISANAGQFFANLGTDLQNDHPISVTYDETVDLAFNAPTGTPPRVGGTLPLYSGRVECGSCHNPHNTTNEPFLRVSNAASALCTTCHIK